MSSQDGQRTIDLFGQNDTRELMGQGDAAEGNKKIRALTCPSGPTIGWPDSQHETLNSLVADPSNVGGKLFGGALLATAIQQNGICGGPTR